jgi:FkbM family methyltransferase
MDHPVAFILASTDHGPLIVNRFDYEQIEGGARGIGCCLLGRGSHEIGDVHQLLDLLVARREAYGPGVVVVDGGANIGTHTVVWAKAMTEWGSVIAFEPQERVYYALAGNIALNNCFNATAHQKALGSVAAQIFVPALDHTKPTNFGGVSLRHIGPACGVGEVATVDSLGLTRLDLLKLDIEGMEGEALDGARETIERCRPMIYAEIDVCGRDKVTSRLTDYRFIPAGMSLLCLHNEDKLAKNVRVVGE